MPLLFLLAATLLAGCGCPTERVSPLRGIAEPEGTIVAAVDPGGARAEVARCSATERTCWFPVSACDVRGLNSLGPAAGELPTWLAVDCHAAGAIAFPLPDLRTVEGTLPLDVPLVRGPLAGFDPDPGETVGRGLFLPADPTCPASAWPDGTRFVGTLRILERAGGPAGSDTLVSPDYRVRAEVRGRVVPGEGPACAVPDLSVAELRFVQTPHEYATVGDRCR